MKISFITTTLNEENTVILLLESLFKQTVFPDEIVIVDGGSTDNTLSVISNFQFPISKNRVKFKVLKKKGNRSIGRNEAIKKAKGDIILCSDAGNIFHKDWIKNIINPFQDKTVDVVAGYYKGRPSNIFQKCLIPYALVMPDKISPNNFLPSTRSMAFRKSVWKKVGGFPEEFSHNEDYVFAHTLKNSGAKIVFQKNAIVYWLPRTNIHELFVMFFRFAYGDAESRMLRPKVILVFTRYVIAFLFLILGLFVSSIFFILLIAFFIVYVLWSIWKNYKYVKNVSGFYFLPLIQFVSDIAVLAGTLLGASKKYLSI